MEQLLVENPRDTQLLSQLASLAENEGDIEMAIQYQRQHLQLAPKERDVRLGLAQLLVKSGQAEEAGQIWVDLVADEPELHRNLRSIDSLITYNKEETALAILSRLSAREPDNWEYLYREGICHQMEDETALAKNKFAALLALNLDDDTPGAAMLAARKNEARIQRMTRTASSAASNPLAARTSNIYQVLAQTGLDQRYSYYNSQQNLYTPSDYGQARLAALAWLLRFAKQEERETAFVNGYKAAVEQPEPSQRALLDWFYLKIVQQNYPDIYAAAKRLSQSGGAVGEYIYLNYLGVRTSSGSSRSTDTKKDSTPPLPAEEIETMLELYAKLKQQKPEWINAHLFMNVTTELERADRNDKIDELYNEAVARVKETNVEQMTLVVTLAAKRGDVETLIDIYKKLDRLDNSSRGNLSWAAVNAFYQATGPLADKNEFPKMLKLLETMQDADRVERISDPSVMLRRQRTASQSTNLVFYKRVNGTKRYTTFTFPKPNPYLQGGNIQLLRTIFEEYKQADILSDLFTYVETELKAAEGNPARKIDYQLMLAYIRWWDDRKPEAIEALREATAMVPDDPSLLLSVAEILEQNNRLGEALELLDSIEPKDQQVMMEREESAMQLAERLGDVERARTAAERLFGLRLPPEKQADLAGRMHRLGMHKEAEAVLARAQRQAGNKTDTLRNLMRQYSGQNNPEMAINIARRILRKSVPYQNANSYSSRQGEDEAARSEAVQVLARSGKLDAMIERAQGQLASSPNSIQIRRNLMEYLLAADKKEEFVKQAKELTALHSDDAQLHYSIAQQLQQAGQPQAACDEYLAAIREDATVLRRSTYDLQQIFRIAKRQDQLVDVMLNSDLSLMRNDPYTVTEMIGNLMRDDETKASGKKLFDKAWKELPEIRDQMVRDLQSSYDSAKMYDYVKEAVFPVGTTIQALSGSNAMSYGNDGVFTTADTMLLDYARKQNRVTELCNDLAKELKQHPDWKFGEVLLAILEIQGGQTQPGIARLKTLIDNDGDAMPMNTRYLIGQELAYYSNVQALLVPLYARAVEESINDNDVDLSYNPIRRAVQFYTDQGMHAKANAIITKTLAHESSGYDAAYAAERKLQSTSAAIELLLANDNAVEAVRVGNALLADTAFLELAKSGSNHDYYIGHLRTQTQLANEQLRQQGLTQILDGLIQQPDAKGKSAFDIVAIVEQTKDGLPVYTNVIDRVLDESKPDAKTLSEALAKVSKLQSDDELSLLIGRGLLSARIEKSKEFADIAKTLQTFVQKHPLEPLTHGRQANSRQRAEAMPRIPLWFVARHCLKREELHAIGTELADHALAAALRQTQTDQAIAILNEWGELELDAGHKDEAEKHWRQMIELVLPTATPQTSSRLADRELFFVQVAAKAPATKVVAAVPTEAQFVQALAIAKMLAQKEMLDLSLETLRSSLKAGPPIAPAQTASRGRYVNVSSTGVVTYTDVENRNALNILTELETLIALYRSKNVSNDQLCAVLTGIVLPEARPAEVFLYVQAPIVVAEPKSLGSILARLAVKCGKLNELRQRAESRLEQPLGQLAAHVLLAQVAIAAQEPDVLNEQLQALETVLTTDTGTTSANLACLVALPALDMEAATDNAMSLGTLIAKNYATSNANDSAMNIHFLLAKEAFAHKKSEQAGEQIDAALQASLSGSAQQAAEAQLRATQLYAQAGNLDRALTHLGRVCDQPDVQLDQSTFTRIVSLLIQLPDAERYRKLKAWSFPRRGESRSACWPTISRRADRPRSSAVTRFPRRMLSARWRCCSIPLRRPSN